MLYLHPNPDKTNFQSFVSFFFSEQFVSKLHLQSPKIWSFLKTILSITNV